jgi:hypothetical protein
MTVKASPKPSRLVESLYVNLDCMSLPQMRRPALDVASRVTRMAGQSLIQRRASREGS